MDISRYLLDELHALDDLHFPYCTDPDCPQQPELPPEAEEAIAAGQEVVMACFMLAAAKHVHTTRDGVPIPVSFQILGMDGEANITPSGVAGYLRLVAGHIEASIERELDQLREDAA